MPPYTYQEQEMLNICFITITYTVLYSACAFASDSQHTATVRQEGHL